MKNLPIKIKKTLCLKYQQTLKTTEFIFKERKIMYQTIIKHQTNKQSIKVIVSACLRWNGATKPFFVTGCGVKVNARTYKRQKELLPAVQCLCKHKTWSFVQENEPSHCSNLEQNFLQESLSSLFIKTHKWPPS